MEYYFTEKINIKNIEEKTNLNIVQIPRDNNYYIMTNNNFTILKSSDDKELKLVDTLDILDNDRNKEYIFGELNKIGINLIPEEYYNLYKKLIFYDIEFGKGIFYNDKLIKNNLSYINELNEIIKNIENGLKNKKFSWSNSGFKFYYFDDVYNSEVCLSESSAVEPQVWLGISKSFINSDNPRMLLNKEMAKELVELLNYFIENDNLPNPDIDDKYKKWLK